MSQGGGGGGVQRISIFLETAPGLSPHILTKLMNAQRRTALFFVTQGVGCALCICDLGISFVSQGVGCASCMCDWVIIVLHRNTEKKGNY